MRVLFVNPQSAEVPYGFSSVMRRQFLRMAYEVESVVADGSRESRRRLFDASRGCDIIFLMAGADLGISGWRLALFIYCLGKRARQLMAVCDNDACQHGAMPDMPKALAAKKGIVWLITNPENAEKVKKVVKGQVAEVRQPVDMAMHNFTSDVSRLHCDGEVWMLTDAGRKDEVRKVAAEQDHPVRVCVADGCSEQRKEEIYSKATVLISGGRTATPTALELRAMAEGKIVVGPGCGAYQNANGEPPAIFFAPVENPGESDCIYGVPIPLWKNNPQSYSDFEMFQEPLPSGGFIEELRRVMLFLDEPEIKRGVAEAGRTHVRTYHDSASVADQIIRTGKLKGRDVSGRN